MMTEAQATHSLDKAKIRFLLLEGVHPRATQELNQAGYCNITEQSASLSGDALKQALQGTHFLGIRSRTQLTEDILQSAGRLTGIGCFCIGTNQVDLAAAQRLGIPVFNAPFSNTRSVAELALAEIIMLMRGIPQRNAAAHRGEWLKSATDSREIRGKILGIVGYGHIGSQLGILAESLGMKVAFFDIENKLPLGNAETRGALNTLLSEADVVSLHVPETAQTRNLIGTTELAAMKPGAFLINASRGTVVDIDALKNALESGHIGGAALDVFPTEPKSNQDTFRSPLRGMDQVIITPHIGGSTQEAQQNIALEVASKLIKYSDNGSTMSAVNFPQVALPDHAGVRRILHIHHNEPGVLQRINQVFSTHRVNIAAQYLQTEGEIGYVVMDVEAPEVSGLIRSIREIDATIRCRMLY